MKNTLKKTTIHCVISIIISFFIVSSACSEQKNSKSASQIDVQSDSYAFPVPFNPKLDKKIIFTNLTAQSIIKIFSTNGELVKTLHVYDGEGSVSWDANNEEGNPVSSDVYVYQIQSKEEAKTGKLV